MTESTASPAPSASTPSSLLPASTPAIAFVDLETSGANFARDRIIEIGIVRVDAQGVRRWSSLVDPQTPLALFITELTGIDDAMLVGAPSMAALADTVAEWLDGCLFIAHNVRFDYGFLKAEFARLGREFRRASLCTVKLSRRLYPEHHRHSLATLIARHDIAPGPRHRALADAEALWALWQCWAAERSPEVLLGAVERLGLGLNVSLPAALESRLSEELPDTAGAYLLLDADGAPLRIGRATNLRQQLFNLFRSEKKSDLKAVAALHHLEWQEAAGEFGARLYELQYRQRFQAPSAELCTWQLIEHGPGDWRPRLALVAECDPADHDQLFGLYPRRRDALLAMRKLAEQSGLCPRQLGLEPPPALPSTPDGGTGKAGSKAACSAYANRRCRGVCIGKEDVSRHSARLMAALGRQQLQRWPYAGALLLVESDLYGMHEDHHLIDRWRYLGCVDSEDKLHELLEERSESVFDLEAYKLFIKYINSSKLRQRVMIRPPAERHALGA